MFFFPVFVCENIGRKGMQIVFTHNPKFAGWEELN